MYFWENVYSGPLTMFNWIILGVLRVLNFLTEVLLIYNVVSVSAIQQSNSVIFCCCSVTNLCPTPCDPTDCGTPGSSVLHHLPEFAQIHVH